ncbi:ArnT family glycosyltransferase [Lolliginicoccus suaedae]|uniref:ArnT family glycosyltransferase n=1 Tax=Lolliginicoccus suaedae TaxID=2605429 RepID=UPI0011ED2B62|nr:glycosyltransferase family 39 protein [Lolliginicoccus suaedae]
MTIALAAPAPSQPLPAILDQHGRWRAPWHLALLATASAILAVLAWRPGSNSNAFQDEGLYLYMGHRVIDSLLGGGLVHEYPGTYFSGAPQFYPVLGAVADSIGGLAGARLLSLLLMIVAVIAIDGIGRQLFGPVAGITGALAFAVAGPVIFVAHLATFDALAIMLLSLATWWTVHSARHDGLLAGPLVGAILAAAFLAKYGAIAYLPGIAALGTILAWRRLGPTALWRGFLVLASAAVVTLFVTLVWWHGLAGGMMATTFDRAPMSIASTGSLLGSVTQWAGPWLALAAAGAVVAAARRQPAIATLLLAMSVIAIVQHLRIGEATSLPKHLAFGLVFAAPLIGCFLAMLIGARRRAGTVVVALAIALLAVSGAATSMRLMTTWVDDSGILPVLEQRALDAPGKVVLGEEPSAQRYALRGTYEPLQWTDTFGFRYGGLTGPAAYFLAIDQSHFGTIYLTTNTPNGRLVQQYLAEGGTPYRYAGAVPFTRRGEDAGQYLVWVPSAEEAGSELILGPR